MAATLQGGTDTGEDWFTRAYPQVVGVVRRVLDRDGRADGSTERAEQVAVEAFSRLRRGDRDPQRATTEVLRRAIAGCTDELVGHPGAVSVHPDLLGADELAGGRLALAELHGALASMRRTDRWVGLLVLAGGFSPSEAAALLQLPLDDVLAHLGRVVTRLVDARTLGLAADPVHSEGAAT